MTKTKKIIILSCMIALLAVTAVFNFILTTENPVATETISSNANYFSQYRTERLTNRNEELLQLDEILSASTTNTQEYNAALTMKTELTKNTENEMLLESLIKAYGFEDAVVVIGLESNNINVMAKAEELTTDDAIIIYSIVAEELNVGPENVKIIPIS